MPAAGTAVTLVAGENDQICPAWQSEEAAAHLEAAGYDTTLVTIPGATHGTVMFLDDCQDEWPPLPAESTSGRWRARYCRGRGVGDRADDVPVEVRGGAVALR